MTEIYLAQNHIMVLTGYGNPDIHTHAVAHIIISPEHEFECITKEQKFRCRGIMIPGGTAHTIDSGGEQIIVFLLDQSQTIGAHITECIMIPDDIVERIVISFIRLRQSENQEKDYPEFYQNTMRTLGFADTKERKLSGRIQLAIKYVKEHTGEELTVGEVSEKVYLSESWFSHLFREETGIAFSSYVVIQKMYHTYLGVLQGKSITESAINAGFSSSAHFAATNRRMFGITARDIAEDYKLYKTTDI